MMIKAFAKVNLILKVLEKTNNNYHILQMVNARINIYDNIYIQKNNKSFDTLEFKNCKLDFKKDDLVLKCLLKFKDYFKINDTFDIKIVKNIPIGAGLGGGSCDCGAILKYLSQVYNVNIYETNFIEIIKKIGADIPYSFYSSPCIVEGIGEIITPVKLDFEDEFIYIYPNINSSTKEVFKNNCYYSKKFTHKQILDKININKYLGFSNDLIDSCKKLYPQFRIIIDDVEKNGYAIMSGSGSSILLFCNNVDLVYKKLKKEHKDFYIKKVRILKGENDG